jgi:hypothetical protein
VAGGCGQPHPGVLGDRPHLILLFDTSTGKEIGAARSPDDPPLLHEALTFSLDGRRLLAVAGDGAAYLWELTAP